MIGAHRGAHGGATQIAVLRQRLGFTERQHHLVGDAERQGARGVHFRRQGRMETNRLVGDQIGGHGDDHFVRAERAPRGLDPHANSRMIDQHHLGVQRKRAGRAIGCYQRTVTAAHPPVDLAVIVSVHIENRNLVQLAAVHIGRDRVDHRVPSVSRLEIIAGRAVAAGFRRLRRAIVESVQRGDEVGALLGRKSSVKSLLAPRRTGFVHFEIQLLGDFDERILVRRMQPPATEVKGDIRRCHDGVAASADAVARFEHDDREAGIFQRPRRAEACGARTDDGDIDFGGEGHERRMANREWRIANSE